MIEKNNRGKLIAEYGSEDFTPYNKIKDYDNGRKFIPLSEKIRMFRADFPEGTIDMEVLMDNNIYATVKCNVECSLGRASALGKWYHTNTDVYGKNYLSTAQSSALSSALKFLGYCIEENDETPPADANGGMDCLPLPFNGQEPNVMIPEGKTPTLNTSGEKKLTFSQVKTFVVTAPPFNGLKVSDILADEQKKAVFIDWCKFHSSHNTESKPLANAVLAYFKEK